MANSIALLNNAPIQNYVRLTPANGINSWDTSRRMQFSVFTTQIGSNITLSSTGVIRLNGAGTYELTAIWQGPNPSGGSTIQWYNENTSAFEGSSSIIAATDSANANANNCVLMYTVTISNATSYSIRDTGGGNIQPTANNSYITVRQINSIVQVNNDTNPVGTIITSVSPSLTNYLLCDGTAYNRSSYQNLFSLLNISKATATITIASPCVVTLSNHGLTTGQTVFFTTTGSLPTNISANTTCYINVIDANTFNLATSYSNLIAGTFINTSGSQSGTHTLSLTIGGVSSATTFNVPNLIGRVLAHISSNHGIGKITGEETHTLSINEMPTHKVRITMLNGTAGVPEWNDPDTASTSRNWSSGGSSSPQSRLAGFSDSIGGGASHNILQPTFFVYKHIKF